MLDHGIVLTVAENLIGNAARFAEKKLGVVLTMQNNKLFLTVTDDGPGFSDKRLEDGPKPFDKGEEAGSHFGMGLYSGSLLCARHGGELHTENRAEGGAAVTASFEVPPLVCGTGNTGKNNSIEK